MNDSLLILAVNRNRQNLELLAKFLGREGYKVFKVDSTEAFDSALLSKSREIHLAMVDLAGFDRQIWQCCQRLKAENIPFLIVLPHQNATIQQQSFASGARTVLVKPLAIGELLGMIRSTLGQT